MLCLPYNVGFDSSMEWTGKMASIIFDTTGMNEGESRRLEDAALFILKNMSHHHLTGDTESTELIVGDDDVQLKTYTELSQLNILNFLGLKLMSKNMVDFEDFIVEKEVNYKELTDARLDELINEFMDHEYVNDIKKSIDKKGISRFPTGTWRTENMVKRAVQLKLIDVEVCSNSNFESYDGRVKRICESAYCAVCMLSFVTGCKIAYSEICEHYFHEDCASASLYLTSKYSVRKLCPLCRDIFITADAEFPEWIRVDKKKVRRFLGRTEVVDGGASPLSKKLLSSFMDSTKVVPMFINFMTTTLVRAGLSYVAARIQLRILHALMKKGLISLRRRGNDVDNDVIKELERRLVEEYQDENENEEDYLEEDRLLEEAVFYFLDKCKEVKIDSDQFINLFFADFVPKMLRSFRCYKVPVIKIAKFEKLSSKLLSSENGLISLKKRPEIRLLRQLMTGVKHVNLQKKKIYIYICW